VAATLEAPRRTRPRLLQGVGIDSYRSARKAASRARRGARPGSPFLMLGKTAATHIGAAAHVLPPVPLL